MSAPQATFRRVNTAPEPVAAITNRRPYWHRTITAAAICGLGVGMLAAAAYVVLADAHPANQEVGQVAD